MFLAGIGSGKTVALAREACALAFQNPGCLGLVCAPTVPMLKLSTERELLAMLRRAEAASGLKLIRKHYRSNTDRRVVLVNGSEILLKGLNNGVDNLRGPSLAWWWWDEAAITPGDQEEVFDVLSGRLRGMDARRFCGLVSTTPKGMHGIVKIFWDRRPEGALADSSFYMQRTPSYKNPYLPENYCESKKSKYSKRFYAQEIEADILQQEGAVYWGEIDPVRHIVPFELPRKDGQVVGEVYCAVDWGYSHPHVLWIHHDRKSGVDTVFDEYVVEDLPNEWLVDRIARYAESRVFEISGFYPDPNPTRAVNLLRARFPSVPVYVDRTGDMCTILDGVETVRARLLTADGRVRLRFSDKLTRSVSDRRILECLRNYRYKERDGDQIKKDDVNDHGADALRYFCQRRYAHEDAGELHSLSLYPDNVRPLRGRARRAAG